MFSSQLLQRSPGEPVNSSTTDPSPNQKIEKEENKENAGIKMALPVTSQSGPVLMQLLNQQGEGDSPNISTSFIFCGYGISTVQVSNGF